MARSDRLFKRCYNETLDFIAASRPFNSVSELADRLDVSRNTARRVIETLQSNGLLGENDASWTFQRRPTHADYYDPSMVQTTDEMIEAAFMNMVLTEKLVANSRFSELALAKEIGVSTSAVREFLLRISRFEFVRKEPQKSWVLEGFTEDYAEELHEVRVLFETRSIEKLIVLPDDHRFWPLLHRLHREHKQLIEHYEERYLDFPALDARFHEHLNEASNNRFINSFKDAITLIFHYHYRWNKADEKERNLRAAQEHINLIEALLLRNKDAAHAALLVHHQSAKETLKNSIRHAR